MGPLGVSFRWVMRFSGVKILACVLCVGCSGASEWSPEPVRVNAPTDSVGEGRQQLHFASRNFGGFKVVLPQKSPQAGTTVPSTVPVLEAQSRQSRAVSPHIAPQPQNSVSRPVSASVPSASVHAPILLSDASGNVLPIAARMLPVPPPDRMGAQDLIAKAELSGVVSMRLLDIESGAGLVEVDPGVGLAPASVTKVATALYALDHMPVDYKFETKIIASGPVENGVIQGNLALIGSGDPTLDSDDLVAIVTQLRAQGITGVTGQFLVWSAALPYHLELSPEQRDYLAYNPSISGLNLNYNRVHFAWQKRGARYDVRLEARARHSRSPVGIIKLTVVERDRPVYETLAPDQWTVARSALGNGGSRWLPVRRPAAYTGAVFRRLAADAGIALPSATLVAQLPQGEVLLRHHSAPLPTIIEDMLHYSNNLVAEVLGLVAGRYHRGQGLDISDTSAAMGHWLNQAYGVEMYFEDHSGLDADNRISARAMTDLLAKPNVMRRLRPLLKPLPVGGVSPYPGYANGKTGTLNFVSNLVGYVGGHNGRQMSFAIFATDLPRRTRHWDQEVPNGAIAWNERARALQARLVQRWRLLSADY